MRVLAPSARSTNATNHRIRLLQTWERSLGGHAPPGNVVLTLSNDHQPETHRRHNAYATSSDCGADAATLVGPPWVYEEDATRKRRFCVASEAIYREHGVRVGMPCAVASMGGAHYARLRNGTAANGWFIRKLVRGRVLAVGNTLSTLLRHPPDHLDADELLVANVPPPLLRRGCFMGRAVATRCELRIYGYARWEPLRVWLSEHSFTSCGSPLAAHSDTEAPMSPPSALHAWRVHTARPACERAGSKTPCQCATFPEALDTAHDEWGVSSVGTSRSWANVVRAHGMSVDAVWRQLEQRIVLLLRHQLATRR